MAQSRREKVEEQPLEAVGFTSLDESVWEQSAYLPSGDDQSWREMEALRIGAYDRVGHLPPLGNQAWREQEALRFSVAREAAGSDSIEGASYIEDADYSDDDVDDDGYTDGDDEASDLTADPRVEPARRGLNPASYVPVREPVAVSASRGAGGGMLFLVAMAGLVAVALAVPGILTSDFWRARLAMVAAKSAATLERVASISPSAPPAMRPSLSSPAPASAPGLDTAPPANNEPPPSAVPPVTAQPQPTAIAMPDVTPSPRPELRASQDRGTMVIGQDGTVKYEDAAAGSKPARARRDAVPAERDAGGFYAMAPGPDGMLKRHFFPSGPLTGSMKVARAPSRKDRDTGGVYAMAPGPDGKLAYQYFPNRPSR